MKCDDHGRDQRDQDQGGREALGYEAALLREPVDLEDQQGEEEGQQKGGRDPERVQWLAGLRVRAEELHQQTG